MYLSFTGCALAICHLLVGEIPTQDDVISIKVGLIDATLELGFVVGGARGVHVNNG